MLNEETADRTLPPTERRRREARMRGQVARSSELTAALLLLTATVGLWFLAPNAVNALVEPLRNTLKSAPPTSLTIAASVRSMQLAGALMASVLAPILLMALAGGLVANLAQTGWLWTPSVIVPRFRRPRLVSEDSAIKVVTTLLRLCAVVCVAARFALTHDWQLRSVGLDEPMGMLLGPARMLGELSIQLAFTLVLVAIVDYGFRYWRNELSLKMTVEERRQEQKEESADPQIRNHRSASRDRQNSPVSLSEIGLFEATQRSG